MLILSSTILKSKKKHINNYKSLRKTNYDPGFLYLSKVMREKTFFNWQSIQKTSPIIFSQKKQMYLLIKVLHSNERKRF